MYLLVNENAQGWANIYRLFSDWHELRAEAIRICELSELGAKHMFSHPPIKGNAWGLRGKDMHVVAMNIGCLQINAARAG